MTLSLRRSWTSWSLRRTRRRLRRATRRQTLLAVALDSQLLQTKELQQQEQLLLHRQQEHLQSLEFRRSGPGRLVELPPPEVTDVRRLLGL